MLTTYVMLTLIFPLGSYFDAARPSPFVGALHSADQKSSREKADRRKRHEHRVVVSPQPAEERSCPVQQVVKQDHDGCGRGKREMEGGTQHLRRGRSTQLIKASHEIEDNKQAPEYKQGVNLSGRH